MPFARVKPGSLAELSREGVIVIAGIPLERQGDRGAWLHALAASGHHVVVLEPAGGTLLLPQGGTGLSAPITDFHMARRPRWLLPLHPQTELPAAMARGLAMRQHRDQTLVEVTDGEDVRFSWLLLEYGYGRGRLGMTTWPLQADFEQRPLQQLAFGRLLDYLHSLDHPPQSSIRD